MGWVTQPLGFGGPKIGSMVSTAEMVHFWVAAGLDDVTKHFAAGLNFAEGLKNILGEAGYP